MDNTLNIQHKGLAAGRWETFSLCEQLAHVGSEVSRALNWKARGNAEYALKAADRMLELMLLTVRACKNNVHLRELTRTREMLVDYFYGKNEYESSEDIWRKYFDQFAYAARKNR